MFYSSKKKLHSYKLQYSVGFVYCLNNHFSTYILINTLLLLHHSIENIILCWIIFLSRYIYFSPIGWYIRIFNYAHLMLCRTACTLSIVQICLIFYSYETLFSICLKFSQCPLKRWNWHVLIMGCVCWCFLWENGLGGMILILFI